MKKQNYNLDKEIRKKILKCIAEIYYFYDKEFPFESVLKSVEYNGRTKKGFESLIKLAEKLAKDSKDSHILNLYTNIQVLKALL